MQLRILWTICGKLPVPNTPLISKNLVRKILSKIFNVLIPYSLLNNERLGCTSAPVAGARLNELADLFASISRAEDMVSDSTLSDLEARAEHFVQELANLRQRVGALVHNWRSGTSGSATDRPATAISPLKRLTKNVRNIKYSARLKMTRPVDPP